jgi:hypothetical protein
VGHEAQALETLRGYTDAEAFGKIQIKRLSIGERDVMWDEFRGRERYYGL